MIQQDPSTIRDWAEGMQDLNTTLISDALGRTGSLHEIVPLYRGARLVGPAFTVSCAPNDNLMCHYAVKMARPGDVLVIATGGYTSSSQWGELLSLSASQRGIRGVVLDGCTRDRTRIETLSFPVFARGVIPQGTWKQTAGAVNEPVLCGGVTVCSGDLVIGDDDGVVVVPRGLVAEVLERARELAAKENEIRRRILAGELMYDFLNLCDAIPPAERITGGSNGNGGHG